MGKIEGSLHSDMHRLGILPPVLHGDPAEKYMSAKGAKACSLGLQDRVIGTSAPRVTHHLVARLATHETIRQLPACAPEAIDGALGASLHRPRQLKGLNRCLSV